MHVGGQVIRTTAEHPFWVIGRGWKQAQQLLSGDLLIGTDGRGTAVEKIEGPLESQPVYNIEIEDYHSYFIGESSWSFSIWSHNQNCLEGLPSVREGEVSSLKVVEAVGEGKWIKQLRAQGIGVVDTKKYVYAVKLREAATVVN